MHKMRPSKENKRPFGTKWPVLYKNGSVKIYKQYSKNQENPRWRLYAYDITKNVISFLKDEQAFEERAQYFFGLTNQQVKELKEEYL